MLTALLDICVASDLRSVSMNQELAAENTVKTEKTVARVKNPELLARMVIKEGKPFKTSAIECGYAPSVAARGLKALCSYSSSVAQAVDRESNSLLVGLDKLKPHAISRLFTEITDLRRPGGLKAIEIAGRFKETDWFVRNVDVQVGVFASFADASPDPAADSLDTYKTEE